MIRSFSPTPASIAIAGAALAAGVLLLFLAAAVPPFRDSLLPACPTYTTASGAPAAFSTFVPGESAGALASALVEYATTSTTPQQSFDEISLSLAVLLRRAPCNFLVFGLGHDSRLWNALNPSGTTVFLEEDPSWFKNVVTKSPQLNAHVVKYRTRLADAENLRRSYSSVHACDPSAQKPLDGNVDCSLALHNLPKVVYEREWDVIMIDAPKGYFAEAPGRMAAIYSAALMSLRRTAAGNTDVFLHDVDRKVEKTFANEFLCAKFRVGGKGRLWHFEIPPATRRANNTASPSGSGGGSRWFC